MKILNRRPQKPRKNQNRSRKRPFLVENRGHSESERMDAFVREPESNACIERFFKTLKEQLL